MSKEISKIEIGDTVRVNFNNAQITLFHRAYVKHKPLYPGDSWVFYDLDKDETHYVSEPCTITLLEKDTNPF